MPAKETGAGEYITRQRCVDETLRGCISNSLPPSHAAGGGGIAAALFRGDFQVCRHHLSHHLPERVLRLPS
ncbi:MAG TPA: hypothetical protein VD835_13830, partial [Pyrinomonadaceae bacterium]|nr:hypothetical protein [Pyrinomonadaceae bacterium]